MSPSNADARFAVRLALVAVAMALVPLLFGHGPWRFGFGLAAVLALIATLRPDTLVEPRRRLRGVLPRARQAIAAVSAALVYGGLVFPVALLLRALGRDAVGRHFDRAAPTYWSRYSGAADGTDLKHPF